MFLTGHLSDQDTLPKRSWLEGYRSDKIINAGCAVTLKPLPLGPFSQRKFSPEGEVRATPSPQGTKFVENQFCCDIARQFTSH